MEDGEPKALDEEGKLPDERNDALAILRVVLELGLEPEVVLGCDKHPPC
jgi:hypothetical protein